MEGEVGEVRRGYPRHLAHIRYIWLSVAWSRPQTLYEEEAVSSRLDMPKPSLKEVIRVAPDHPTRQWGIAGFEVRAGFKLYRKTRQPGTLQY